MSSLWLLSLSLALVVVLVVRGEEILNEPDWGFQSYLEEDFTLVCNHSDLPVEPYNQIKWELPSGQMLSRNTDKYVMTADNYVSNMRLEIKNVQESDSGVYLCHVYSNFDMKMKRGKLLRGLNIGGHKYRDAFDEYRNNLMIGGIAAVVLFVPLVVSCFIYKFRFQTPEQKQAKREARIESTRHQRHLESNGKGAELAEVSVKGETNTAYDNGGDQSSATRL